MEATFLLTLLVTFLASFIGYELISKIPQTLHTPLMSGSNAISGITLIAGILIYPEVGSSEVLKVIVLIAIGFATLNIVGGFSVTGRILEMFKKMIEIILLLSTVLFIFALKLFGKPSTAHRANTFAMLAMALAVFSAFNLDFSKYDAPFYITIAVSAIFWCHYLKTRSNDTDARVGRFI